MSLLLDGGVSPANLAEQSTLAGEAFSFHQRMPDYSPTPCHRLDQLAAELGVGSLLLKDESHRFGLNAFKGLGASFAIDRWLRRNPERREVTFTTATDGNHGRAVAWSARKAGHSAVIFIPSHARPSRISAIEAEGATVVLVPEGYDAAVEQAHQMAAERGWVAVQDTASEGYTEIPDWIAAGYWTHARELEPYPHAPRSPEVDLVLLHAGVGTWAAAIACYYWHRYGERRPRIGIVEPTSAACVQAGVAAGTAKTIDGSVRTVMAGLDCALASTSALSVLSRGVDAFFTIEDRWSLAAMRALAAPLGSDPMVVAGESGAASLAGLMALTSSSGLANVASHLGLDSTCRVLIWSTEGATDPIHWEEVVGRPVPA